jgi:branched-chain amino acid transport system ATP-binding protein
VTNALEINTLVKEFGGVRAVDELSLTVPKGKITGLIGPNGSGKTTLANVLTGMYPIDDGSVTIGESERKNLRPYQVFGLGVTRTFQGVRVFEQISVFDNVMVVITQRSVWGALFERHKSRELCDTLVVMDAGKLLAEGTAAEVLADRRVIEAYLGA